MTIFITMIIIMSLLTFIFLGNVIKRLFRYTQREPVSDCHLNGDSLRKRWDQQADPIEGSIIKKTVLSYLASWIFQTIPSLKNTFN